MHRRALLGGLFSGLAVAALPIWSQAIETVLDDIPEVGEAWFHNATLKEPVKVMRFVVTFLKEDDGSVSNIQIDEENDAKIKAAIADGHEVQLLAELPLAT